MRNGVFDEQSPEYRY
jgi:hypothetical protein